MEEVPWRLQGYLQLSNPSDLPCYSRKCIWKNCLKNLCHFVSTWMYQLHSFLFAAVLFIQLVLNSAGLVHERRNSIVTTLGLCLSCTKPSILCCSLGGEWFCWVFRLLCTGQPWHIGEVTRAPPCYTLRGSNTRGKIFPYASCDWLHATSSVTQWSRGNSLQHEFA